jgi:hypothetical protein
MTSAEFIAACFWPLVVLFGLLLAFIKDRVLRQSIGIAAIVIGFVYLGLWVFFALKVRSSPSSIFIYSLDCSGAWSSHLDTTNYDHSGLAIRMA